MSNLKHYIEHEMQPETWHWIKGATMLSLIKALINQGFGKPKFWLDLSKDMTKFRKINTIKKI
jgi:hypothetical protein